MRFWLTQAALLLLLILAVRRGGQPEKYAAYAYVAAFLCFVPAVRLLTGAATFQTFDSLLFATELIVLIVIGGIALRANRWWPLCASALQLIVVITHVIMLAEIRGASGVYWGMTTIPTYLQYLCLLLGISTHTRRLSSFGPYPDWRES